MIALLLINKKKKLHFYKLNTNYYLGNLEKYIIRHLTQFRKYKNYLHK